MLRARPFVGFLAYAFAAHVTTYAQVTEPPKPNPNEDAETLVLSPFEVTAKVDQGYAASTSLSGTRVATPIENLPMTVNIITKDFLDDAGIQDLQEAVRYTAGAYQAEGITGDQNAFQIRGIRQNYSLRNGFRSPTQPSFFAVGRVEVVKGPASVLYGQAFPGGVLNYLTPKPQAKARTELSTSFSDEGAFRATFDSTGSLTKDGSLQYRIMGGYRYFDYVARYADFHEYGGNFQLQWTPTQWLSIRAEVERFKRDEVPVGGQVVYNVNTFNAAIAGSTVVNGNPATYTGYAPYTERDWNNMGPGHYRDRLADVGTLTFDVTLPRNWHFRSNHNYLKEDTASLIRYFNTARNSGIDLPVRDSKYDGNVTQYYTQNDLTGAFLIGGIKNNVLIGVEAYRDRVYTGPEYRSALFSGRVTQLYPTIAPVSAMISPYPFNVLPLAVSPTQLNGGAIFTGSEGENLTKGWSVYATDQINLMDDRLFVMIAGRFEKYKIRASHLYPTPSTYNRAGEDAPTGQLGILYKAYQNKQTGNSVSGFVTLSQSFRANTANDPSTGELFPPETGEAWEVGVKAALFGGKLNLTASQFGIYRKKVVGSIAERDANGQVIRYFSVLNGQENAEGFELEGIYSPVPNYQIVFSYSDIHSYIAEPGDQLVALGVLKGQKLSTPDDTFALWNRYKFESGPAKGLSLGIGVNYVGPRLAGNYGNQTGAARWIFQNEPYTRWDALIGYSWKWGKQSYNFSINASNLTDKIYYLGTSTRTSEPRTFMGTLKVTF